MINWGFEEGKRYRVIRKVKLHTKPLVFGFLVFDGVYRKETQNYYVFDENKVRKDGLCFYMELGEEFNQNYKNDEIDEIDEIDESDDFDDRGGSEKVGERINNCYYSPKQICEMLGVSALCFVELFGKCQCTVNTPEGDGCEVNIADLVDSLESKLEVLKTMIK